MNNPEPTQEPYPTHEHNGRDYLVNGSTGKCWFCGQVVPVEPIPGQMELLNTEVQLEMEVRV